MGLFDFLKPKPVKTPAQKTEEDFIAERGIHYFHGNFVINDPPDWATKEDVFEALGSKYPLNIGDEKYWGDRWSPELVEKLKKRMTTNHPDGHLWIGGGVYWDGQGHILTVGGSRSGKGTDLIIPALLADFLAFPDAPSFVVLDPKGENLAVTGKTLQSRGYNVLAVNPFAIPEIAEFGNARFNPFDLFTANDPDFDKYADMIAFALLPDSSHENDFFDKSARGYISLYIRHMMSQAAEPKNFRTLYKWLRLAGEDRIFFLNQMIENDAFDGDIRDEAKAIRGQLVGDGERVVEGIYASVRTATDIFKDTQLRESVSGSDIDIKTIAKSKTAIFVCLNPADLHRCQAWLRMFFGSVMRGMTKHYNKNRKVVMLMDEFATMGRLKEFEIAAGFLAGYNVTLWPVLQDLTQLSGLYPKTWETFINNAIIRHYLSIGDNFTAEYISKRMPVIDYSKGSKAKGDYQQYREPLLRPDEIITEWAIIVEIKGMLNPARFHKTPYYKMGMRASPNPFLC